MGTELFYLYLTSVLLAVMWIPHIIGQATNNGPLRPEEYVTLRDPDNAPNWVRRANRAHLNLVEQFGAFAGLVVVAQLTGATDATTAIAAAVFFWARVAHAAIMIAGVSLLMLRTMIFLVSWLALVAIAWHIGVTAL
jgi:uncharacterized MAPEG superfamily protein